MTRSIRQVEGEGFQEIPQQEFNNFKQNVRDEIDKPLLQQLFPLGQILRSVHWESHGGRTRLPAHLGPEHTDQGCYGKAGITFGRQIGAYPILIGTEYLIPLESSSDILVTGHGARSITGMEIGLDHDKITEKQLSAIPGIGSKTAWKLISQRAKLKRKDSDESYDSTHAWFTKAGVDWQDDFQVYFTK